MKKDEEEMEERVVGGVGRESCVARVERLVRGEGGSSGERGWRWTGVVPWVVDVIQQRGRGTRSRCYTFEK